jgi:hypothetical protein
MAKLPKEWRVYARGDPDGEFRRYRTHVNQCKTAEARRQRIRQLRRAFRQTALWGLILAAIVALGWRMLTLKPLPPPPPPSAWPAEIRAKHMAASRSCDAARAAGLAPATRGYPGIGRIMIATTMASPANGLLAFQASRFAGS